MRRRAVLVTATVAAVLFVLLGVALVAASIADREDPAAGPDVLLYEARLLTPARQGGQSVEMGLKVAIGDLGSEGRTSPAVIAEQVPAWRRDLLHAREVFAETEPPPGLDDAQKDFVAAMDAYIRAADFVGQAATAPEPDRERLLDRAIEAGRRGDRLYDRASGELQRARRRAGLPPSLDFPDR